MDVTEMDKPGSGKSGRQLRKLQLVLRYLKPVRLSLPDIAACQQPCAEHRRRPACQELAAGDFAAAFSLRRGLTGASAGVN
ncbi:hypothetical protein D3C73_1551420 [compost metagenome]